VTPAAADGLTELDAVLIREGKNLAGRMTGFLLGTVAKGQLDKALGNPVKGIEARGAGRLDA
jgi:hypothetical protein